MSALIHLENTTDFADTIKEGIVLVDFYADWCGPCQALGPVMESLADSYDSKAKIMKINVDHHSPIAQQFRVMSIPTVIIFQDGNMVDKPIVGAYPQDFYANILDTLVG